jgi:cytochrome c oxidase assembly protein subunit 11
MDQFSRDRLRRRNRFTGIAVGGFVLGMVGLAFASVPLYRMFCQLTGYNGTPMLSGGAAPGAGTVNMTIRFNANVQPGLPWRFQSGQPSMTLPVGEQALAFYRARNNDSRPVTGIATYNVTPEVVGRYFHKTACFCFEQQTLQPGEEVDMPISFWVDPKMIEDPNTSGIRTITIHYSFFRSLDDAERSGALANAGEHVGRRDRATP